MIINVIKKNRGNKNSPDSLNVMVNYHYHSENRIITPYFQSMLVGTSSVLCQIVPTLTGSFIPSGSSPIHHVKDHVVPSLAPYFRCTHPRDISPVSNLPYCTCLQRHENL